MAGGRAYGVSYADEINAASAQFGVPAALIQAMRDIDSTELLSLNDQCTEYAKSYNRATGERSDSKKGHFMSVAWFLYNVSEMLGSEWAGVSEFYGGGPGATMKTLKIAAGPFQRRSREWA
jgi:hypothetical protein